MTKLLEKMKSVSEEVQRNLHEAQTKQKQWYDKKTRECNLEKGIKYYYYYPTVPRSSEENGKDHAKNRKCQLRSGDWNDQENVSH